MPSLAFLTRRGGLGSGSCREGLLGFVDEYPDDIVYPLHTLDTTKTLKKLNVLWTYRFNDVLDADKLDASLTRLLEIGDWRKAGGRLRTRLHDGRLEIHTPRDYSAKRPATTFTRSDETDCCIACHPVASTLPEQSDEAYAQRWNQDLTRLALRRDIPTTLQGYTDRDVPMISVHVVSFRDATLVGVAWPHVLMDAAGQLELMRAWSLVLAGREAEVAPVLGALTDPLWEAAGPEAGEKEPCLLEKARMTLLGVVRLVSRLVWTEVVEVPPEYGVIFLPRRSVYEIQARCIADGLGLDVNSSDESVTTASQETKAYVGVNDAVTAWLTQQVVLSQGTAAAAAASATTTRGQKGQKRERQRHVTVVGALNARYRLPSLLDAPGVHVQNMILATFTFLSPGVARGPLGGIAQAHRRCLREQATQRQAQSYLWDRLRGHASARDLRPFFGDPGALLIFINNLTKMDMYNVADFGPAVVEQTTQKRGGEVGGAVEAGDVRPGKVAFYNMRAYNTTDRAGRNFFTIYGRDHGGGCWIGVHLAPRTWERVNKALEEL
ncbi:hypothetical protein GMORB2_1941 [Geosmithia morbida]|uniref:Uncharacterized protein n=1 Tax=Geosmithia morbida TaxID=1094350 RepID=A0A9P5CZF9_9HYPO|nr:uncharacterized protein GMORB2_1941 [Geosmithia morbida]KAF4121533.1 hypothetical protein GMORB2_1941 [Geosmithia morbida]